jgi:hypothetical protein
MAEHPIIYSTPMVRAYLNDKKTQTRRVIKNTSRYLSKNECLKLCPYGQVGDKLWVRECFISDYAIGGQDDKGNPINIIYKASWDEKLNGKAYGWKPSIHMFRSDSRLTQTITSIRVERLQDITEEDAIAEGTGCFEYGWKPQSGHNKGKPWASPISAYADLWDSINGKKHPWANNDWVWVISYPKYSDEPTRKA